MSFFGFLWPKHGVTKRYSEWHGFVAVGYFPKISLTKTSACNHCFSLVVEKSWIIFDVLHFLRIYVSPNLSYRDSRRSVSNYMAHILLHLVITWYNFYSLVIKHGHVKYTMNGGFVRKSLINGPFSTARFDYQRVTCHDYTWWFPEIGVHTPQIIRFNWIFHNKIHP